jgi:GNAT superfamily N-acetyltransferase
MSITFTSFPNLAWKDKIDLELTAHLESHTGLHAVQSHGIYGFYEIQLIGGVICQRHHDILWIEALWVDAKFRRQGIGGQLIQQVINFARQHSLKCLQLNTYFEEARCFFRSCDFEEAASIPNWKYGSTCYFMKKTL